MSTSVQTDQEKLSAILDHFNNEAEPFSPGMVKDFLLTVLMDTWANAKGVLLQEKDHGFTIYKLHQFVLMLEKFQPPREFSNAVEKHLNRYGMNLDELHNAMIYAIDCGSKGKTKHDKEMTDLLTRLWRALKDGQPSRDMFGPGK